MTSRATASRSTIASGSFHASPAGEALRSRSRLERIPYLTVADARDLSGRGFSMTGSSGNFRAVHVHMHRRSRQFARRLDAKNPPSKEPRGARSSGAPRLAAAEAPYLCIVSGQCRRQIQRETQRVNKAVMSDCTQEM